MSSMLKEDKQHYWIASSNSILIDNNFCSIDFETNGNVTVAAPIKK